MAQLVARLVRNEKVGGSNPPSSTTGRHLNRMSVFCMPGRAVAAPGCRVAVLLVVPLVFRHSVALLWGYRTKRVGFMVTFRLFGAEKSVLKLVGANLKDGLNVLVL